MEQQKSGFNFPWPLLVFLFLTLSVSALGGLFTASSVDGWYLTLTKPSWNPPNWIFGPVWIALYIFMAIAAWLVWENTEGQATFKAMLLFGVQLGLNLLWSFLFFGFQRLDLAFFEIILLWVFIAATMVVFFRHSKIAGFLFVPYLAWVSFAAYLNYAIWQLI